MIVFGKNNYDQASSLFFSGKFCEKGSFCENFCVIFRENVRKTLAKFYTNEKIGLRFNPSCS
jgi:hypothetical protein